MGTSGIIIRATGSFRRPTRIQGNKHPNNIHQENDGHSYNVLNSGPEWYVSPCIRLGAGIKRWTDGTERTRRGRGLPVRFFCSAVAWTLKKIRRYAPNFGVGCTVLGRARASGI